jgi:putative aminopeptidase FrvX
MELLERLSRTPGAPGREERVRDLLRAEIDGLCDRVETDAMGNLFAWIDATAPQAPRLMLACHMDEIAFYVRHIDKRGFLRLQPLGGFDPRNLLARRVRVQARDGDLLGSLNGGKPIHIQTPEDRKAALQLSDLFVDLGLPADEVLRRVRVGDPVTLEADFLQLGDLASGKCLDNRVACWVGVRLLQQLRALPHRPFEVVVCFTVQEEIGVRGALVAANRVRPDLGVAIDVTLAVDHPGASDEEQITHLGRGVAIKIMDSYSVSDRALVDELIDVAERHNIPHQLEILPLGGTDAGALQRSGLGCRAVTLSVPCRYVHTITETVHRGDLRACVDLLVAWISG